MPAARDLLSATASHGQRVYESFKDHTSALRMDTRGTITALLRANYPDFHVTETRIESVSLLEFAKAGKASVVLDHADESFAAGREWYSVGERLEKRLHPGELKDKFRFARFQYIWEDKEYVVYYAVWNDPFKVPEELFYILYPRVEANANITDGHCAESDALLLAAGKWTSQLHDEIFVFDHGRWQKSKDLWKAVHGSSWNDVILAPETKRNLIEDVQGFFNNQPLYAQFAVPWKRGIILHGVPGNGKTVSIKALMSSLSDRDDSIPSLYVKSFETRNQTEQYAIQQIFSHARACAPCLLIFEDLDSLVTDEIRSYFLNEVDGLESNDGILMIGSTNHLDKLDPAIAKRPSRFDRKYHFKLPGEEERRLYAAYWRNKLLENQTVAFPEELCTVIAKLTKGFSFAYLKELFVMALLILVRGNGSDGFGIVDVEEGGNVGDDPPVSSAEGESKPSETGEAPPVPAVAETCTCASVCDTCHKPLPSSSVSEKKADEDAVTTAELKTNEMVLPTVNIPDELAENLLLRVVQRQIRILHAEMDSTTEGEWPSGRKELGGSNMGTRRKMRASAARC